MTSTPLFELNDVSMTYRPKSRNAKQDTTVTALACISLAICIGEFFSVVGTSGCGKTTLLNLLAALDVPTTGTLSFRGRLLGIKDLEQLRRKSIGIVFQFFNLQPSMSALENVALGLTTAGFPRRMALTLAGEWLARVGLADRVHHRPNELSGGQQQRVAIARAMAKSPEVLIADEPTGNLDSRSGGEILDLMSSLNESGTTIVMVTHDRDSAKQRSSRVIELEDGRIAREWQPAD